MAVGVVAVGLTVPYQLAERPTGLEAESPAEDFGSGLVSVASVGRGVFVVEDAPDYEDAKERYRILTADGRSVRLEVVDPFAALAVAPGPIVAVTDNEDRDAGVTTITAYDDADFAWQREWSSAFPVAAYEDGTVAVSSCDDADVCQLIGVSPERQNAWVLDRPADLSIPGGRFIDGFTWLPNAVVGTYPGPTVEGPRRRQLFLVDAGGNAQNIDMGQEAFRLDVDRDVVAVLQRDGEQLRIGVRPDDEALVTLADVDTWSYAEGTVAVFRAERQSPYPFRQDLWRVEILDAATGRVCATRTLTDHGPVHPLDGCRAIVYDPSADHFVLLGAD